MKLIWHLIEKDIRRDRWALVLWALLFVGQVGVGVMARNPREFDLDLIVYLQTGSMTLVGLQMVMGYVLVARLVQADALIGNTHFWMTRPISRGRLLLAKGLGALLIFGLVPVLLLLPWWLYCGFGWREIFWTGVETLGWQLLMIALAFLVATLTDDLGRLLLWTLLLIIALLSWSVLLQAYFGSVSWQGRTAKLASGIMFTRLWFSAVVLVVGAGAVAAHHYLTRHFIRSVVLVVCWLGVIAGVGRGMRSDWSGTIAALPEPKAVPVPGLGDGVAVKLESASGYIVSPRRKGLVPLEGANLQVLLRVDGIPGDLRLVVERASHSWVWSDGIKLERSVEGLGELESSRVASIRHKYSLPTPVPDAATDEWYRHKQEQTEASLQRRVMRVQPKFSWPADRRGLLLSRPNVPSSLFVKMQAEPSAYGVDLHGRFFRPEVLVELPVSHESRASGNGETLHFRLVGKDDEALVITHPGLRGAGLWFSAGIGDRSPTSPWRRRAIMQVNRVTGDVVEGRGFLGGARQMMIAGVAVYWSVFDLQSPKVVREGRLEAKYPEWRKDTFLAMVVDRDVGRFDRVVLAEKFEVRSLPVEP